MAEQKLDIEKILKEYKEKTQKILELLDDKTINLIDDNFNEKELKDEEIIEKATDAELFWKKHYRNRMKVELIKLLMGMGKTAELPIQVAFFRGIMFAYQEERDWFETQIGISVENRKKPENSQDIETIGEINL